ncbi:hypothetical protein [Holdemania filiformis]|uniref:hypothetical protein n=1 Tax=Holdemania filiformis TaxID=61171 RepID=UPI00243095D7|nr:hypothetical protein [Holdemania filiformis]
MDGQTLKVGSRQRLSIRSPELQNKKTPSDEVRRKAGDSQEGILSKPGVFIFVTDSKDCRGFRNKGNWNLFNYELRTLLLS